MGQTVRSLERTRRSELDDALVNLELQPVHDALRSLVAPDVVRQLSDFAELPRGAAAAERKSARERNEFIESVWARCENFLRTAQASSPIEGRQAGVCCDRGDRRWRAGSRVPRTIARSFADPDGRIAIPEAVEHGGAACAAECEPAARGCGVVGTSAGMGRAGASGRIN